MHILHTRFIRLCNISHARYAIISFDKTDFHLDLINVSERLSGNRNECYDYEKEK